MKANLLQCRDLLQGKIITCAISGGADSVALLHGLWSVREELELTLYAAHFHHGLRQAADEDARFVKAFCEKLNVPLTIGRGDAAAHAQANGMSVEEAARHLRYGFLLQQPGLIAVAHHADDQVETVLLNLLRGTGLKGLCAMQQKSGRIIRPFLHVTRQQIEAYLAENDLSYCLDETNQEDDALRNRLRHHVVPLLKQENPALAETVSRMTVLLQQDEAYLSEQTQALLETAKKDGGYDCRVLRSSPMCQRAVRSLLTISKPAMHHVQAVCDLMEDLRGTKQIQLPGMCVRREYEILYFGAQAYDIPEQIEVSTEEAGIVLWGAWRVSWQANAGGGKLIIRPRQSGDCIRLPGGSKNVKKLLIDRKIPVSKRDNLPVVTDGKTVLAVADVAALGAEQAIKVEERKR